jgi:hypothetical protein
MKAKKNDSISAVGSQKQQQQQQQELSQLIGNEMPLKVSSEWNRKSICVC